MRSFLREPRKSVIHDPIILLNEIFLTGRCFFETLHTLYLVRMAFAFFWFLLLLAGWSGCQSCLLIKRNKRKRLFLHHFLRFGIHIIHYDSVHFVAIQSSLFGFLDNGANLQWIRSLLNHPHLPREIHWSWSHLIQRVLVPRFRPWCWSSLYVLRALLSKEVVCRIEQSVHWTSYEVNGRLLSRKALSVWLWKRKH